MLAMAWRWSDGPNDDFRANSSRLGASLCSGIGGEFGSAEIEALHFAYRPLRSTRTLTKAWRPAVLPNGTVAAFHGYFDNASAIAAELGADRLDLARLYAIAVESWGDDADRRIIGEYCAIIARPDRRHLRLSRSPLRAPPLYHFHHDALAVAGSVPRVFFAAGVPQKLNEARVADSAMINFSNQEASWFENIYRVPLGSVVELQPGFQRVLRRYYDPLRVTQVRVNSDAECIARVGELLDEAVNSCLSGFTRPGATLSAGLDSSQIAVRALAALPGSQKLPTFTFHPEPGFDGSVQAGMIGDERPLVEEFAAMHPGIEPHFTANEGYEHDYRWNDFFHLMGAAPSGLCNLYVFHGLFAGSAREGCDLLLVSDWGNNAFSDKGYWGYVEYLLKGRWRQLWLSLRNFPIHDRSMFWRFFAQSILPLLPNPLWRRLRRVVFGKEHSMLELMQPFAAGYRHSSGANDRLKKSALVFERYQPWSARHARKLLLQNDDGEAAEVYQAFEQMYGVAQRDPMAYRPLVEYCWGLPTRMFMRNGTTRWIAKELARGMMPEKQRANELNGRWDADWHLRLGRRRKELLEELGRLETEERFANMIDIPRLRTSLESWPEQTETDFRKYSTCEFAVPRALLTARFIKYVERSNA